MNVSSGTGLPGLSWIKGRYTVVVVVVLMLLYSSCVQLGFFYMAGVNIISLVN